MNNFENFGLPEGIIAALNKINFTTPTPIQEQAIPVAMNGCDILGSAQTGTGKTGDHHQFVAGNVYVNILQIVDSGPFYRDVFTISHKHFRYLDCKDSESATFNLTVEGTFILKTLAKIELLA